MVIQTNLNSKITVLIFTSVRKHGFTTLFKTCTTLKLFIEKLLVRSKWCFNTMWLKESLRLLSSYAILFRLYKMYSWLLFYHQHLR